ncbi:MAG: hypothetical protein VB031_04585 [Eubacteriaceae bacterium]|nr:hypothetical protein [Eubacteriaceae bacterium]
MKCGVRFCGGCNPRYDRGAALKELEKQEPDVDFQIAEEGVDYDYLLVIGGCTNCCASHCQFSTKEGVVKMWDEQHIDKVIKNINKVANNIK